jgi:hypothetical protein
MIPTPTDDQIIKMEESEERPDEKDEKVPARQPAAAAKRALRPHTTTAQSKGPLLESTAQS